MKLKDILDTVLEDIEKIYEMPEIHVDELDEIGWIINC